ncbi:hypothetical protein ACOMHN_035384 [Nucella lapillus]
MSYNTYSEFVPHRTYRRYRWNWLPNTIHRAASHDLMAKKERKNTDWFEANTSVFEPVINAKCSAVVSRDPDPNHQSPASTESRLLQGPTNLTSLCQ